MKDSIFLLQPDRSLTRMTAQDYESEALLQDLISTYPDLLAGAQIDPESPRRWVLLRREMGVPAFEGGGAQWAVDHLYIDQDGIPTIIEVKRASDTRIRREVVGQMLDYAANGVRYWPIDGLQIEFATRCAERGLEQGAVLAQQLGVEDADDFWAKVRQNLDAGRVRLVFVADAIPGELQRIIEFLNGQMSRAQVVGLEVQQFVSPNGLRTLVPRVVGQTAQARLAKGTSGVETYAALLAAATSETQTLERRLLEWAQRKAYRTFLLKSARQFDTEDRIRLLLLLPGGNHVEFRLKTLEDALMLSEKDEILAQLRQLGGHNIKDVLKPKVGCAALLRSWQEFESKFLPNYVLMRREAHRRKFAASADAATAVPSSPSRS